MKIHLVDGTFELFRAFYGPPKRVGPGGREVGAVRGLLRSMASLLAEDDVTHVAVAFDHVIESFRNGLFAGYKTGDGVDPLLLGQFELAERGCRALGLVVWPMVEFEADDAMAAAAARFAADAAVEQIVLCSPDKDLGQAVVGRRVIQRDRMRKRDFDAAGVRDKLGVAPASVPDFLALVGDTADGIPGLPRWGAKSTAQVLGRYPHLADIPDDAAAWDVSVRGAAGLAQTLATRRGDAELYRTLATLRTDVPLTETLDDLRWRGADAGALATLEGETLGPLGLRLPR
ncbi:MAG: flap endonuclease [Deltaproteobacteria bacterium HGW-Deltaproteobacteria-14]|jgi:5'-3' exonuclease|nr:MAG: flap endonuclease [Deltaproteobacteria bacterium HGW-Deltaproteobacteria-14]